MNKLIKLCLTSSCIALITSTSMLNASGEKISRGSSVGKYAKPGAPVDIRFTSQNVETGERAEVKINLLTSIESGNMDVSLKLDSGLYSKKNREEKIHFNLTAKDSSYSITLHLSANDDNVYYVRLIVRIEGKGVRAFAVPVFIGEGRVKKSSSSKFSKSASGEKLSVSKAVESRD